MTNLLIGLGPAVMLVALALTAVVRKQAIARQRLDIPNARSSHQMPTPRGGGLALVLAYLLGLGVMLVWHGVGEVVPILGVIVATASLAAVGFVDDAKGLSARARLMVQLPAACVGVWAVGGAVSVGVFGWALPSGFLAWAFAITAVVWLTNLTNFMDGIDGIAGSQATLACGLAAGLAFWVGEEASVLGLAAQSAALLSLASLGFLVWNWPPAKIFMGDVGSATLGLLFGVHAYWFAQAGQHWFWVWLILLGVFIMDATFTLLARLKRRQPLGQAHRSHAYQRASRHHGGHKPVTLAVIGLMVFWLLPWATAVATRRISGELGIMIAYFPLLLLCIRYKAGMLDD